MNALAILEEIGYKIEFASPNTQFLFNITGIENEPPSETVWYYVEKHRVEISQALRQRQSSEV